MRLSATLALRVAAIGVTLGAVAVPASLAHATVPRTHGLAATPTVVVDPSTGVKDGDTVKVSGTNFPADQPTVYVVECSGKTAQSNCDLSTLATGSTGDDGSFNNVMVTVHSGTVGDGKCKPGGTCYIAASTSASSQDATNSGFGTFTFVKSKSVATKTTADFKHGKIVGAVKAAGKGVKGLKTKLEIRAHGKWKAVDTLKTHKHGAYASAKITRDGKYLVKTPKQTGYKSSTSKIVKVRTGPVTGG